MATSLETVWIACPRCGGHGGSPCWKPDFGICYRCGGNRKVRVDVARTMGALRHLRAKFVALRAAARAGEDVSEALSYCVSDGRRVRETLEAAGVEVR